jgi:selenocysteine lyase/cysteine desulfurase
MTEAFAELVRGVHASLQTYANVHRGSGHNSLVTTRLYEEARQLVLEHLGLGADTHVVVFSTPRRADALAERLGAGGCRTVSSEDVGLPLGLRALALERSALPRGIPLETGGGTARLVAPGWVVWARPPERFEAGTPPVVNVIAFAKALPLVRQFGKDAFRPAPAASLSAEAILRHDTLEAYSGQELIDELRKTVIGRGLVVPTCEGLRPYVNLDNAASTRTLTPIWNAVCQTWRQPRPVQEELVREVRSICAEALGAPLADYDVVFTSNTTEAINLVAQGLRNESSEPGAVVLNTLLEHNSNELPWRYIPGVSTLRLGVDADGFLDLDELEKLLSRYDARSRNGQRHVTLVAVSGASNVLGSFNDLAAISGIVHRHGARLLVDAAQLVAHREIDMEAWGIDALAFSAHKVYAPFGTGVLIVRKGMLRLGAGEMERIRISGEENVGGIAALGKALVLLRRIGFGVVQEQERALTARTLRCLARIPGIKVYGVKDPDSPRFARKGGVIPFGVKRMMADRVAEVLGEHGIGVRWGCHCAHMLVKRLLHVPRPLEEFQRLIVTVFPRLSLPGVARVSLGLENTEEDVDRLIEVLGGISGQRRDKRVQRQMDAYAAAAARTVYDA